MIVKVLLKNKKWIKTRWYDFDRDMYLFGFYYDFS